MGGDLAVEFGLVALRLVARAGQDERQVGPGGAQTGEDVDQRADVLLRHNAADEKNVIQPGQQPGQLIVPRRLKLSRVGGEEELVQPVGREAILLQDTAGILGVDDDLLEATGQRR